MSALISRSRCGARVFTAMSPASALAPYAVPCGPRSTSMRSTSASVAGIPMPEKSMPSMRNPTDGFGAPCHCDSSPIPRNWKKRGREVPADQLRLGTRPSTSWKCCTPAISSVRESSTVALAGRSLRFRSRSSAVTRISSSDESSATAANETKRVTNKNGIAHAARNEECIPIPPPVLAGSGSTGSRPIRVSGRCNTHWPPRGEADSNRKLLLE